jgi:outer membrane protein
MPRLVFPAVGLAVFLVGAMVNAVAWPVLPVAEAYVQQAWSANVALQRQQLNVTAAEADATMARAARRPRLDLAGRYSMASGGRIIEVPSGDLINPVYAALNQHLAAPGQSGPFPTVSNFEIPLLREREQETKLRLTVPLLNQALRYGLEARQAAVGAAVANQAAARRDLRRAVLEAYYLYLTLHAAERIWTGAVETTTEALRAGRVLYEVDRVTEDHVLRAEADDLAARQGLIEATQAVAAARYAFNALLHRSVEAEIDRPTEEDLAILVERLIGLPLPAATILRDREELAAWQSRIEAAGKAEAAVRAQGRASFALLAEGGVQGTSYRTGSGANYGVASVVGELNLWDGQFRRGQLALVRVQRQQAELARDELHEQLVVEAYAAINAFHAARLALPAAERRAAAAQRTLELVAAREHEGLTSQLAFLDARQTATTAALDHEITRLRLLVAASRVDRALAASALD